MKKQRTKMAKTSYPSSKTNFFDLLSEEIIFIILDYLNYTNPQDRKSFSLVSKSFYSVESKHRRTLKPLRSEYLPSILHRYSQISTVDLTLCPRITDYSLSIIASTYANTLHFVDLSRSKFFSGDGLAVLVANCVNLKGLDLSNSMNLRDSAVAAIGEAKNLENLWLGRCKFVTDIGIGCIAVGCPKLKLINLKWCLGIGDLGIELVAVKCKELRSLDLSYLPV